MTENWDLPADLPRELETLLTYWNEKRSERAMPLRSEIDPLDFPKLLRGICLLELETEVGQFRRAKFRLAGTDLYQMIGFEVTGKYVDEIVSGPMYDSIEKQFEWVIESRSPVYRRFTWEGSANADNIYERLFVPLGATSERVGYLLGMHAVSKMPSSRRYGGPDVSIPVG